MEFRSCEGQFVPRQLKRFLDTATINRLEHMQQQEAIRAAGLEDLVECPFCDYKAIYPPIEENRLFECQNPECEITSCRACRAKSHVPLSCQEAAKDHKVDVRHALEEAMTEALVRSCK